MFRIQFHLFRVQIQHFRLNPDPVPDPDPIRIQGFDDQKLEKNYSRNFLNIFNYPLASRKDVQATGEALIEPSIKTFRTWKHEISELFLFLWPCGPFSSDPDPDSESGSTDRIEFGSGFEALICRKNFSCDILFVI